MKVKIGRSRPALCILFLMTAILFGTHPAAAADPLVAALAVEGNDHVVSEHILGVVRTAVGEPLNREQLQSDVEAIYALG